jgi:hypothetical protein
VTISVETELRSRASPSRSTICSAEHTCTESYGCVCVYIAFGSADLDLRLRCSDFQTTAHALVWAFTSYVPTCGNEGVNTTLVEPAMLISVVRSTFPGPLRVTGSAPCSIKVSSRPCVVSVGKASHEGCL